MTTYEVQKAVREERRAEHQFIKWWRKEEDFLDFDLLDRFLANAKDDQEIGGFDLVDMKEMWDYLERVAGDKVQRVMKEGVDTLLWMSEDKSVTKELPFTAESLIQVFDEETDSSFIDS